MKMLPGLIRATRWLSDLFDALSEELEVERLRRVSFTPPAQVAVVASEPSFTYPATKPDWRDVDHLTGPSLDDDLIDRVDREFTTALAKVRYHNYEVAIQSTNPAQFPHCDARVLHAPTECEYCDMHENWQTFRTGMGIAFTGHEPRSDEVACPADAARPPGSPSDHRHWGGNKPTGSLGDPSWPAESAASLMLYGDRGGRA